MRIIARLCALILAAVLPVAKAQADSFAAAYGANEYGNPRQDYE